MTRIGFSLQADYGLPITQVIALLKASGFTAVSPVWSQDLDLESIAESLAEHNMTFQSLHAPHRGISTLWNPDDPVSVEIRSNIMRCIDACAQFQVPIMVMHGWQGLIYRFPSEPLDFGNFDIIVNYARQKGVSIAFENLEGEEYLEALMTRYQDQPHVGYCWDSGHDHCYPHETDFLNRNPSEHPTPIDDLHFLPYDGNIDWDHAISRLKGKPGQSTLNFEIKLRYEAPNPADLLYSQLSMEEFLRLAGERARRIASIYDSFASEN